jgi:uncharacterized protein
MIDMRVLIVSDFHGSNACMRKLISVVREMQPTLVLYAGDITGKETRFVEADGPGYVWYEGKRQKRFNNVGELKSELRSWADVGIYGVLKEVDHACNADERELQAKVRRYEQWRDSLETELKRYGGQCYFVPGNDDDDAFTASIIDVPLVRNVDGRVISCGAYRIGGLGYSNGTPYHTDRELSEEDIASRLKELAVNATERRFLLICHVPPYESGLDEAPEVVETKDGTLELVPGGQGPVGSRKLREFIQEHKLLLVCSGHCHDSSGFTYIGDTLCVNPGSAYHLGTMNAMLVVIQDDQIRGYQSLVR